MAKFVVYADSGGKYRWRLVSSNGQTTATSGELREQEERSDGRGSR
jgi:uncharacterized protein YegP (UPF0339 family)